MADKAGKKSNPLAAFFGFGLPSSRQKAPKEEEAQAGPRPVAAHVFSGRFLTYLLIIGIIALSIYSPLTSFLKQQEEINQAKANIASLQAEQEELKAQVSWWKDDNYVKQQAKSRLFYVEPGVTPYLVVGLDASSDLVDDTSAAAKTAPQDSWTAKLWGSVQLAAQEPEASPSPAVSPSPAASSSAESSPASEATPSPQASLASSP